MSRRTAGNQGKPPSPSRAVVLSFFHGRLRYSMTAPERSALAERLGTSLDPGGETSLSRQIADHIWLEVIGGVLETGERLPTVRQLAIHLELNPKTVEGAFEELERLGVVSARPGEGTYVTLTAQKGSERERRLKLESIGKEAVERADALGYSVNDLIDTIAELRGMRGSDRGQ